MTNVEPVSSRLIVVGTLIIIKLRIDPFVWSRSLFLEATIHQLGLFSVLSHKHYNGSTAESAIVNSSQTDVTTSNWNVMWYHYQLSVNQSMTPTKKRTSRSAYLQLHPLLLSLSLGRNTTANHRHYLKQEQERSHFISSNNQFDTSSSSE